jgi:uncharacterized protein (TIGR02611 family)
MGLRDNWERFKKAEPGTRFEKQYEANQRARKKKWTRSAMIALGVAVLLVGLVALPAPGPGTLVLAAGVALLARESRWIAEKADSAEVTLRRLVKLHR